jgi:hypothetical protein
MPKSVRTTRPARRSTRTLAGLDVPVQHASRVHLAQRGDQSEPDPCRAARAQRPVLRQDPVQGAAVDQFHHDPQAFALVHHVVHAHDVGVVDPGRGPGLAQGAFAAGPGVLLVHAVYAHFLDGDLPVEDFVGGPPHPPHSPLTNAFDQPVTARHQQSRNTAPRYFRHPHAPLQHRHRRTAKKHNGHNFVPHQHSGEKSCGTSSSTANSGAVPHRGYKGDEHEFSSCMTIARGSLLTASFSSGDDLFLLRRRG